MITEILFFTAPWCQACQSMKWTLEDPRVKEIDIDAMPEFANMMNIKSLPTFVFVDENRDEHERIVGVVSKSTFEAVGRE